MQRVEGIRDGAEVSQESKRVATEQVRIPEDVATELLVVTRLDAVVTVEHHLQLDIRRRSEPLVERSEILNRMRRQDGQPRAVAGPVLPCHAALAAWRERISRTR